MPLRHRLKIMKTKSDKSKVERSVEKKTKQIKKKQKIVDEAAKHVKTTKDVDKIKKAQKDIDKDQKDVDNKKGKIKQFNDKIKKERTKIKHSKRKKRLLALFSFVGLPGIIFTAIAGMGVMMMSSWIMYSTVTVLGGVANPAQRAILKASNAWGDDKANAFPKSLLGSEPDLSVQDQIKVTKASTNTSDNGDGTPAQNAKLLYDHYKGKISDARIAAILGNFAAESNISPHRFETDSMTGAASWQEAESKKFDPSAIYGGDWQRILGGVGRAGYDNGHGSLTMGLGIMQWTGPRGWNLLQMPKWDTLSVQLGFMDGPDGKSRGWDGTDSWAKWASNKDDVSSNTIAFLDYQEGNPGQQVPNRLASAANAMKAIQDGTLEAGKADHIKVG